MNVRYVLGTVFSVLTLGLSLTPALAWDGALCEAAISRVERMAGLPPSLLHAVGVVETGRMEPRTTRLMPWPWSINVNGQGQMFASKLEAIAAVQAIQAGGVQSIDIGCMQVNLMYHKTAFASLEEGFDPDINVAYAARFLGELHGRSNDWRSAVSAYHSQDHDRGAVYADRVGTFWPTVIREVTLSSKAVDVADGYTPQFRAWLAQAASDHARLVAATAPPRARNRATRGSNRLAAQLRNPNG